MKTIFNFLWNMIMLLLQTETYPAKRGTAGLGVICSLEAFTTDEKPALRALPDRQPVPASETLQANAYLTQQLQPAPNMQWKAWCDNNKMLFRSSA